MECSTRSSTPPASQVSIELFTHYHASFYPVRRTVYTVALQPFLSWNILSHFQWNVLLEVLLLQLLRPPLNFSPLPCKLLSCQRNSLHSCFPTLSVVNTFYLAFNFSLYCSMLSYPLKITYMISYFIFLHCQPSSSSCNSIHDLQFAAPFTVHQ